MKKTRPMLFVILILFCVFNSFAQDTPELIPFCSGGKWGYCNQEKETIIPVEYFFTGFFREGLVRVKLGGKWGFINISGRKVVPLKYDWAWDFTGGLAWVSLDGNWGYIDHRGTKYWED